MTVDQLKAALRSVPDRPTGAKDRWDRDETVRVLASYLAEGPRGDGPFREAVREARWAECQRAERVVREEKARVAAEPGVAAVLKACVDAAGRGWESTGVSADLLAAAKTVAALWDCRLTCRDGSVYLSWEDEPAAGVCRCHCGGEA